MTTGVNNLDKNQAINDACRKTAGFPKTLKIETAHYNPGQKHKIHHPLKNHVKGGCTNHMGYF